MRTLVGVTALLSLLAACGRESAFGFRLPEGNADRGRIAFVDLHCNACHEIENAAIEYRGSVARVMLGGQTTRVHTYGELVTSIINPSHRIAPQHRVDGVLREGDSIMSAVYLNDIMTVQQLVDLVAFLQGTYEIVPPPAPTYWYAYP